MHVPPERGEVRGAEWTWALGWSLFVVFITVLPYLYAQFAAQPGSVFSGFIINPIDGHSYLAKMRQGYEGEWFYRLAFSPEAQPGVFVFTLYLTLGHVARLSQAPMVVLFHGARPLGGMLLLMTVYGLSAQLTNNLAARRWAFAVAAFGSGLGLLSQVMGRAQREFVPTDFYIPEANIFYAILANPHFPLMMAFEALALLWVLKAPRGTLAAQCGLLVALGLGLVSLAPYLGPVAVAVALAGALAQRPLQASTLLRAGAFGVGAAALLAYYYWSLQTDTAVAEWSRQNVTPSPPLLDTLLGLGLWLPLASLAVWRLWTAPASAVRPWLTALVVWLGLSLALMYVPYDLQRRFAGGLFVPVAVLGGIGLQAAIEQSGGLRRVLLIAGVLAFGFSTNALILAVTFGAPHQNDARSYLSSDEAAALAWLEERVTSEDVVLTDIRLGNFVPGYTGARVVYGHPMETLQAAEKRALVEAYFEGHDSGEALARFPIRYVLGGPPPAGWQVVFESGSVRVYGR